MTSLWSNVSVNVIANSCLLISAPIVHWKVQPTADRRSGRFNTMHGVLRALHVSQQCLLENCPQMLEKEQWPPNNSPNLNGMKILCLGSDARSYYETFIRSQNSFRIKNLHWRRYGTFSAGPIKLSRVLQSLTRVRERWRKTFISTEKVFALTAFSQSWIVETIFENVSTAKLPWLKAA